MGGIFFQQFVKKNGEKRKNVNRGMQEGLRIKNQFYGTIFCLNLSKYFIRDPLFLSSKNGHKNHLRNFWSEKCPFLAIFGKI